MRSPHHITCAAHTGRLHGEVTGVTRGGYRGYTGRLQTRRFVNQRDFVQAVLFPTGMTAAPTQADEPGYTRKRFKDFLTTHTVYELIPESGKVVLLDVELPVRQAFHALHEQGVAAASLWDAQAARVAGIISASDFIYILRRLRNSVSSGANPMSEEEMDQHTIRGDSLLLMQLG